MSDGGQRCAEHGARCAAARPSQNAEVRTGEPPRAPSSPGRTKNVERCTDNEWADAIARVLAGDVNAYEVIFRACNRRLRTFIAGRYGHLGRDFIDEVAMLTHEFAFTHISEYDSDRGASFATWLLWQSRRIANHAARDLYNPRFVPFEPAKHEVYAISDTGPVDSYEEKRLWQVLEEETEALPEGERQTVVLHDIEARSHRDMARAAGLTYEQERYRHRLIMKRLRKRLKERGVRPVPVDTTPEPIWFGNDGTEPDDDYTTSVTAVLPSGPKTLVGAATKEKDEE